MIEKVKSIDQILELRSTVETSKDKDYKISDSEILESISEDFGVNLIDGIVDNNIDLIVNAADIIIKNVHDYAENLDKIIAIYRDYIKECLNNNQLINEKYVKKYNNLQAIHAYINVKKYT